MLKYITTLTIRIAPSERKELKRRASQAGLTVSALVREILRQGLAKRSVRTKAGRLRGISRINRSSVDSWRREIRERNWRQ